MVDSIGNVQAAISSAPVLPVLPTDNGLPVNTTTSFPAQPAAGDQVNISQQAVQKQGQPKPEYANPEVLGTEAVTTYMVNGQLYTRYRDENTGKLTYLPKEAEVLPGNSSESSMPPVINITA